MTASTEPTQGAALLREAAARMRKLAEGATPVPWRAEDIPWRGHVVSGGSSDYGFDVASHVRTGRNAAHIASWHPAVALAVADWLETTERDVGSSSLAYHAALAVAREFLGRTA